MSTAANQLAMAPRTADAARGARAGNALVVAAAPAAVARQTIAHHSKSFALASRLLGARLRDQTAVVYTWCRRADDAVDGSEVEPDVLARLASELDAAYAGTATDPVLAAFGAVARERAIPRAYPDALVDGMAMDLAGTRYRTIDDLIAYAYRVAGVVGLMMTHVFGVTDDDAIVPAAHLGIGMQLTNICRDVAEDWQRGRIYIPDELLAAHGAANLADPLQGARDRQPLVAARVPLAGAVRDLLALADRYYRSADRGMSALPRRARIAVRAARSIYSAIGAELARTGYDVTAPRAVVPRSKKLALALGACVRGAFAWPLRSAEPPRYTLSLAQLPRFTLPNTERPRAVARLGGSR